MGGTPVLGYDIDRGGGRLVVNPKEASRVRKIFELYREHGSLDAVVEELSRRVWSTKSWKSKRGIEHGGRPFAPISLFRLLTNIVYTGKVEYHGTIYDGEQPPIIEFGLWQQVNAALRKPTPKLKPPRQKHGTLLAGLLFCESCQRPMIPTYSGKGSRRYRYYVCQGARENGWKTCSTKSVSAALIEDSLMSQLRVRLNADHTRLALKIPDREWQAFTQGHTNGFVSKTVGKLRYNGAAGTVSVELRTRQGSQS